MCVSVCGLCGAGISLAFPCQQREWHSAGSLDLAMLEEQAAGIPLGWTGES